MKRFVTFSKFQWKTFRTKLTVNTFKYYFSLRIDIMDFFSDTRVQNNGLLNVNNNKKHTGKTIVKKIMITASIPLELKRRHLTARRSIHMLILASH